MVDRRSGGLTAGCLLQRVHPVRGKAPCSIHTSKELSAWDISFPYLAFSPSCIHTMQIAKMVDSIRSPTVDPVLTETQVDAFEAAVSRILNHEGKEFKTFLSPYPQSRFHCSSISKAEAAGGCET